MTQDKLKKQVAWRALDYLVGDSVIGVGTGSTVGYFIEALASVKQQIIGAVSSSEQSSALLTAQGIKVLDANQVDTIQLYVDGADEINPYKQLIKGGGAALTREKIVAAMAKQFVCIADSSKQVAVLGKFPLPIEVIPMARAYIARQLVKLGGTPQYRQGVVTDNGNHILDVYGLSIVDPCQLETQLNGIAGVVTVGLFAHRAADIVLIAGDDGVKVME